MTDDTKQVRIPLTDELHWRLKVTCAKCKITLQEGLARAIREWMEKQEALAEDRGEEENH